MTPAYHSLISDPPKLHSWDGGKSWNTGGFNGGELASLHEFVARFEAPVVVETGAGCSTLAFLLASAKLASVAPNSELFGRIRNWLEEQAVEEVYWEAILGISEEILPVLASERPGSADIVLIDGNHGWPTVFVDFCYLNRMLRKDGILILDDVQLHSVAELGRLLLLQPGWVVDTEIGPKTVSFRKTNDAGYLPGHVGQPYITLRSSGSPGGDKLRI